MFQRKFKNFRSCTIGRLFGGSHRRLFYYRIICFLLPFTVFIPTLFLKNINDIFNDKNGMYVAFLYQKLHPRLNFDERNKIYYQTFGLFEMTVKTVIFCLYLGCCYNLWRSSKNLEFLQIGVHLVKPPRSERCYICG